MCRFIALALCLFALLFAPSARAGVIINEFMAENDGFLSDLDEESPDWVELHNNSAAPVNLAGWHLTDTPTNLARWTFPSRTIPAGGYLVVFASGKDRTNGVELHTDFRLSSGGGYIALVQPDGTTVASAFSYGQQHRNVSFGPSSAISPSVTLLGANSPVRWLMPANGTLGQTWTTSAFNDAAWSNAVTPLTFFAGIAPGTPVLSVDFNDDEQITPARETGAADTEHGFDTMTLSVNPSSFNGITVQLSPIGAGVTLDDRDRGLPTPGGALTLDQIYDDFIFVNSQVNGTGARIDITGLAPNTDYRMTLWSFDSSSANARISDWIEVASGETRTITNGYTFNGSILPTSDSDSTINGLLKSSLSGALAIEGRRNGGVQFGVFLNALQLSPLNAFAVSGNLAAMHSANASVYTRSTFNVDDPSGLGSVSLRIKYNDGFVAYVNGVEVARRNAPASPAWNSSATAAHSAALAEDIPLPGALALLTPGANTLAIHGLNLSATNVDFFLEPQLVAALAVPLTNAFYSPATPGASNNAPYVGVVADTKFSVDRGFYESPFALSITCETPGAEIRYTTNGSAPTATTGFVVSGPLDITGHSFIRAQAFLPGWIPSGVDTHSYIFLRDVLRQSNNIPNYPTVWQANYPADYAMDPEIVNHPVYGATLSNDLRSIPSLMIVSDHNGLWNSSSGIYPNATSSGSAWERAASIELIDVDGGTEFATTSKIEMHGNASRDNVRTPKHSMRLTFSAETGPTRLNYDWFDGGVSEHNAIILRSCGFVDGWAGRYADNGIYTSSETGEMFRGLRYRPETTCYLRDVWVKESFRDMGWTASRTAFVHLYLNGLYWGLYQPSERLEGSYFALHHGGEDTSWDVLVGNDNGGPPDIVAGSGVDWTNVLNIANAGITNEAAFQAIAERVDLDNLIDYMMLHIFAESEDWPHHNWFVAHRRETNGVPGTKFIVTVWDQELTLDRLVRRNRINVNNSGGEVYSPARVYAQLRNWPEFRRLFGDRVHRHLFNNGALTPTNNVQRLLSRAAIIRNAVVGESARWGDARKTGVPSGQIGTGVTFTRDEWWQPEIDKLATNFLQKLTGDNVARFRAGNLYPAIHAPTFNQFGGQVPAGFSFTLAHTNASGTIYFTTDHSDPRVYGSGAVAPGAQAYGAPVPVIAPTVVKARVLGPGNAWSALVEATFFPPQDLSKLALTEIMYRPPAFPPYGSGDLEFIELKNTGTNSLDLTGVGFTSGVTFNFPNGTQLAPGAFFVIARNTAAFTSRYPGVTVNGLFTGQLANEGERVALSLDAANPVTSPTIFSLTFGISAPWPIAPNGFGFSLVPVSPGLMQAPDDGRKWRASTAPGGSPGADDPASGIAPIAINEALTHTDLPQVDRIELFNPTATNVNIGGWFLTDDAEAPQKFRIPDGTIISAGGFLTFDETHFNATPGTNNSFSLGSNGEEVYLLSGGVSTNLTGWSHGFEFDAAAIGVSFGRHVNSVGEEQFPAQIANTFNAVNAGPRVGPLVINEIHYHPDLDHTPFVELKNITGAPLPLFDPVNPANRWELDGAGGAFPPGVTIPSGGLVLLVASNVPGFIARYAVPTNVPVFSYEFLGTLQRDGERLTVRRPGTPVGGQVPSIVVDSVRYNDKAPWPAAADGTGPSLQRIASSQYGDDPINWMAAPPSPGRENTEPDGDGDGIPDSWEVATGTDPGVPDANGDPDGDGLTNFQEYAAGTHPNDAASHLRALNVRQEGITMRFEFNAASNRTFTVLFKDVLDAASWSVLTNISAHPQPRLLPVIDSATNATRFYRLAAP